jgi:hypothetical protein
VVTAHEIEASGRKRTILLFHGELDHAAAGLAPGTKLDAGAELGVARRELGAGLIAVYVEARELREGGKLDGSDPKRLLDPATAVATDVRNALPVR